MTPALAKPENLRGVPRRAGQPSISTGWSIIFTASKPCGSMSRTAAPADMPTARAFVAAFVQPDFNDTVL
jgi:hypothetical protein